MKGACALHLLFDLDGTLTDSLPGISRCINYALGQLGREQFQNDRSEIWSAHRRTAFLPRYWTATSQQCWHRLWQRTGRDLMQIGFFESSLFPDVTEALAQPQVGGHSLQLITAKPAVVARRVLAHFQIQEFFYDVHGPELRDRTCNKADFVGRALVSAGHRPAQTVMDRVDDVLAAKTHNI